MRVLLFLTVLAMAIAACDKSGTDLPIQHPNYSDRLTVAELHNEAAVITAFCGDTTFLYLSVENHSDYTNLMVDSTVLWDFIAQHSTFGEIVEVSETGCLPNYTYFVEHLQNKDIKVSVSGIVKHATDADKTLLNFDYSPFVLEDIVKLPECTIDYEVTDEVFPLENLRWRVIGLVKDEVDTLYPPCEFNYVWMRFATDSVQSGNPDQSILYLLELETGANVCSVSYFQTNETFLYTEGICTTSVPYTTGDISAFNSMIFDVINLGRGATINMHGNMLTLSSINSPYKIICVAEPG